MLQSPAGGGSISAPLPQLQANESASDWKVSVRFFSYLCRYYMCLFMVSNIPGLLYGCSAGLVLNIPAAVRMNRNLKAKLLEV